MHIGSILVACILSLVSLLHFYWAFGGRYGIHSAAPKLEGQAEFRPPKALTFIVACLLGSLAVLAILLTLPNSPFVGLSRYIGYLVSVVFVLRAIGDFKYLGLFKKIYNSDFSKKDTLYFSPLCLFLGISFALFTRFGA